MIDAAEGLRHGQPNWHRHIQSLAATSALLIDLTDT